MSAHVARKVQNAVILAINAEASQEVGMQLLSWLLLLAADRSKYDGQGAAIC